MGPEERAILERLDKRQELFETAVAAMSRELRELMAETKAMAAETRGRFEALDARVDIMKEAIDAVADDVTALRHDLVVRHAHFAQKIGMLESDVAVLKGRK